MPALEPVDAALTTKSVLLVYGPLGVLALIGLTAAVYLYKRSERRDVEHDVQVAAVLAAASTERMQSSTLHLKEREDHREECRGERDAHWAQLNALVREHKEEMGGMVERVVEALKQTREDARADNKRVLDLAEALERRVVSPRSRG